MSTDRREPSSGTSISTFLGMLKQQLSESGILLLLHILFVNCSAPISCSWRHKFACSFRSLSSLRLFNPKTQSIPPCVKRNFYSTERCRQDGGTPLLFPVCSHSLTPVCLFPQQMPCLCGKILPFLTPLASQAPGTKDSLAVVSLLIHNRQHETKNPKQSIPIQQAYGL